MQQSVWAKHHRKHHQARGSKATTGLPGNLKYLAMAQCKICRLSWGSSHDGRELAAVLHHAEGSITGLDCAPWRRTRHGKQMPAAQCCAAQRGTERDGTGQTAAEQHCNARHGTRDSHSTVRSATAWHHASQHIDRSHPRATPSACACQSLGAKATAYVLVSCNIQVHAHAKVTVDIVTTTPTVSVTYRDGGQRQRWHLRER